MALNPARSDLDRASIDIELKEIDLIFAQGHVRMTIIAQVTNFSVTLAGALAAALATLVGTGPTIPIVWFLVFPLPFFMFSFLVLREDMLMAEHDRYYYQLRKRLLKRLDLYENDVMLRFLPEIKSTKIGRWVTLLSGLRYGPPLFVVAPSLGWYGYNADWLFTARGVVDGCLVLLNVLLLVLLLLGIVLLGRAHIANESLASLVTQGDA